MTRRVEKERPSRDAFDLQFQRLIGRAPGNEIRVQRMGCLPGHGGAGSEHGLGHHLPAEDAIEATGLRGDAKPIAADRHELERTEQPVECRPDRALERAVSFVRPAHAVGSLGTHGDMASTPHAWHVMN